jgi:hypothetical protein
VLAAKDVGALAGSIQHATITVISRDGTKAFRVHRISARRQCLSAW